MSTYKYANMYQTEKTERYDLEESGEFLQAVEDPGRTAQNILDELDYQVGFFRRFGR